MFSKKKHVVARQEEDERTHNWVHEIRNAAYDVVVLQRQRTSDQYLTV